jgi:hypothetical protein
MMPGLVPGGARMDCGARRGLPVFKLSIVDFGFPVGFRFGAYGAGDESAERAGVNSGAIHCTTGQCGAGP